MDRPIFSPGDKADDATLVFSENYKVLVDYPVLSGMHRGNVLSEFQSSHPFLTNQ